MLFEQQIRLLELYVRPLEFVTLPLSRLEYLFQRGELGIANLDEVSQQANPVIQYETRRGAAA